MSGKQQPGRAPPFPDVPALLSVLVRHEVAFVVIGGIAVAHHGFPRATKDLDIVPRPDRDNLLRLWDALVGLDARPLALEGLRPEELPVPFSSDALLEGGNWACSTVHGRLDLLQYLAGRLEAPEDYDRLENAAVMARYDFGEVRYVGYEDLLDLKNLAGRDQDLIDVRGLREARDNR